MNRFFKKVKSDWLKKKYNQLDGDQDAIDAVRYWTGVNKTPPNFEKVTKSHFDKLKTPGVFAVARYIESTDRINNKAGFYKSPRPLSTTVVKGAGLSKRKIVLIIRVPKGMKCLYVPKYSRQRKENELLFPKGTILYIQPYTLEQTTIYAEIVHT